jgi:hypothetical protein
MSSISTTADSIEIDPTSLLVGVPAGKTLDAVETALAARGFTLGVALDRAGPPHAVTGAAGSITVGDWLAAPWDRISPRSSSARTGGSLRSSTRGCASTAAMRAGRRCRCRRASISIRR